MKPCLRSDLQTESQQSDACAERNQKTSKAMLVLGTLEGQQSHACAGRSQRTSREKRIQRAVARLLWKRVARFQRS
eukprot:scaffold237743_cov18-Tisochrysis_lutea.AAC.1